MAGSTGERNYEKEKCLHGAASRTSRERRRAVEVVNMLWLQLYCSMVLALSIS